MKRSSLIRFAPWVALMFLGVTAAPRLANPEPQGRHSRIRAAIVELRGAREELRTATHDFCGHKKEAIERTDAAIHQLQIALSCDRQ